MVAQNLDKLCVPLVLIEVFRICYPRYPHCPINDTSYQIIHCETEVNHYEQTYIATLATPIQTTTSHASARCIAPGGGRRRWRRDGNAAAKGSAIE
jgi:hypothetical protein